MKKIPTLFVRDPENPRHVTDRVAPGCEWVLFDAGVVATRKWDGTCTMLRQLLPTDPATWWARREVKPGKTVPPHFQPIEFDGATGKTVGWEPIDQSPFVRWHAEALDRIDPAEWTPGTYELCGPKVNGNPEGLDQHELIEHAEAVVLDRFDGSLDGVYATLAHCRTQGFEGVVFRHPDGRMAKLKVKDLP